MLYFEQIIIWSELFWEILKEVSKTHVFSPKRV